MKAFSRFLLILFSILIGTLSLVTLFMSLGWTTPLDYLNQAFLSLSNRWIIGITSGLILFGILSLVWISLRQKPLICTKIALNEQGEVSITLPAIEALVQKAAFQIKGVKEVKPVIKCTGEGIALFIKTSMLPGTAIPQSAQELQTAVQSFLEETAGIRVVEVKVLVTHVFQESKSRVD